MGLVGLRSAAGVALDRAGTAHVRELAPVGLVEAVADSSEVVAKGVLGIGSARSVPEDGRPGARSTPGF
jgi:hypothetical protein